MKARIKKIEKGTQSNTERNQVIGFFAIVILSWLVLGDKTQESFEHFMYIGVILLVFWILISTFGIPILRFMGEKINNIFITKKFKNSKLMHIGERYLANQNFLNHHNYFRNYTLEKQYTQYKLKNFIGGNIILIILGVGFTYFFPQIVLEILLPYFIILFAIIPLIIKDRIVNLGKVKKPKPKKIFFRSMNPCYYQRIQNKIFFY